MNQSIIPKLTAVWFSSIYKAKLTKGNIKEVKWNNQQHHLRFCVFFQAIILNPVLAKLNCKKPTQ
jgi:hypothetical protein